MYHIEFDENYKVINDQRPPNIFTKRTNLYMFIFAIHLWQSKI